MKGGSFSDYVTWQSDNNILRALGHVTTDRLIGNMYRMDSWGAPKLPGDDAGGGDEVVRHLIFEANVRVEQKLTTNNKDSSPVAAMTGSVSNGNQSNGTAATDRGCWTIGLINSKFKYLSAETFGYKINANGKALKKKQVWILEPSGDGDTVVMRSHLNKFIAVDQFGNVTCDQVGNLG